jgi:glycosyltransferase involved in cell wall biosynthesis
LIEATLKEMSPAPLVSFVVPCYKYAHLLGECVGSILVQDYGNFEVLIMDNCSPDNTPEVAQSFQDARVRHIRNDSNLGAEENFNKGLTLARGKYVWVLSADDLLRSPSILGRFVDVLEQNVDLGFVFCRAIEFDGEKEKGIIKWADCGDQDCTWNDSTFVLRLIEFNCIAFSCVMMRKECLNRVGMFPVDLPYAADWYLWIMFAMNYRVSYLAEPSVVSRVHEGSLTAQQSREYARICVADEFRILWRAGHEAELAQHAYLRDACRAALIQRARRYLMTGLWGTADRMKASEFEEILSSCVRDLNDLQQIRMSVYSSLADDVRSFYHVCDAPIDPNDEIDVYWDLWQHAELAGVPSLRYACKLVLAHRLSCRLKNKIFNTNSNLSGTEFAEMLQGRIPDMVAAKDLRALTYRDLAEQQYGSGEYVAATQSYRLALEAHPSHPATLAKYLFMRTGRIGIWIRKLIHQVRESTHTT